MVNYCPECGEKVTSDAKFCTNCGNPLLKNEEFEKDFNQNPVIKKDSTLPKSEGYLETTECPFCHNKTLDHYRYKKAVLFHKENYSCTNCGAKLSKEKNNFKLMNINNKQSNVWINYQNQTLTKTEWIRIGNGGLSDKDAQIKEQARQAEIARLQKEMNDTALIELKKSLTAGTFDLPTVVNSPIMLKKGEDAVIYYEGVTFREPRSVRVTKGGGGGTSFRVSKGVTVHTGRKASKSESHYEIKNIDIGTLTITTKRLVFTGSKKNVNIPLKKIISLTPYSNGIAVRTENKQKTQYFVNLNGVTFNYNMSNYQFKTDVDATVLQCLIQGLLKK